MELTAEGLGELVAIQGTTFDVGIVEVGVRVGECAGAASFLRITDFEDEPAEYGSDIEVAGSELSTVSSILGCGILVSAMGEVIISLAGLVVVVKSWFGPLEKGVVTLCIGFIARVVFV